MTAEPAARHHDLDALRAFAMLLGIALHAALSFMDGIWMVRDDQMSGALTLLVHAVHGFRMPLFFLLSGFFTAMLWRKRGLRALLLQRWKRIVLPLLLGCVTLLPLLSWVGNHVGRSAAGRATDFTAAEPRLWHAAALGDQALAMKLIREGHNLNATDPQLGMTALAYAVMHHQQAMVRLLLERGADVNAINRDGGTALHGAAFWGRSELAEMLLTAGADPELKNRRGDSPYDATLINWGLTQGAAALLQVSVQREPLEQGRQHIQNLLLERMPSQERDAQLSTQEKKARLKNLWLLLTRVPLFGHLWFLWYLCWMVAAFAILVRLLGGHGLSTRCTAFCHSKWSPIALLILTSIPVFGFGALNDQFGPHTSPSLIPPPGLLLFYGLFFFVGAVKWESRDRAGLQVRHWAWKLLLALAVLLPLGLWLARAETMGPRRLSWLLQIGYVWLMCDGMMGLFQRFIRAEHKAIRYLADASYWMYLIHLPLVILAQHWVRHWPQPALLKFAMLFLLVFALCLLTYRLFVRHTRIGHLLNGKRG